MKKPKKYYPADGYNFVSVEELHFYYWLKEAIQLKIISASFTYQPEPFKLIEPVKIDDIKIKNGKLKVVQVNLLQGHTYQPDFLLHCDENFFRLPHGLRLLINEDTIATPIYFRDHWQDLSFYIDVKGSFNQNDAYRRFSIDQKLMYEKYKILVHKIIPQQFFLRTWVPMPCIFQKRDTTKRVKAYENCRTIAQRINEDKFFLTDSDINLTNCQTSIKFDT